MQYFVSFFIDKCQANYQMLINIHIWYLKDQSPNIAAHKTLTSDIYIYMDLYHQATLTWKSSTRHTILGATGAGFPEGQYIQNMTPLHWHTLVYFDR